MIQRLSHVSIYVLDQDAARDFYVNKLGFEIRTDATMDGFRWLTVGPKGQSDLEIVLMPTAGPTMDKETSEILRTLIRKSALGAGVMEPPIAAKPSKELKARGVEFMSPPTERFYGIKALFQDDSGNWFSMTQRKEARASTGTKGAKSGS